MPILMKGHQRVIALLACWHQMVVIIVAPEGSVQFMMRNEDGDDIGFQRIMNHTI